jgi:hypothetical protein
MGFSKKALRGTAFKEIARDIILQFNRNLGFVKGDSRAIPVQSVSPAIRDSKYQPVTKKIITNRYELVV